MHETHAKLTKKWITYKYAYVFLSILFFIQQFFVYQAIDNSPKNLAQIMRNRALHIMNIILSAGLLICKFNNHWLAYGHY